MEGGLGLTGQAGFAEEGFYQANSCHSMQGSSWRWAKQLGVLSDLILWPPGGPWGR